MDTQKWWCSLSLFDRLLKLINADAKDATLFEIVSTFCKVHQNACSGLKNQAIGSSRGGKNTKIHVLLNERMQLFEHGAVDFIPDKANFKIKPDFGCELYKQRNIVERSFQQIKNYRHISTRFDKLVTCFENFVLLATSVIHF